MHTMGKTFIVSGPSGVGKSTVLHALFEGRDDLYFSVSATTRTPREGERDGVDYHFIHADRFRNMIAEDAFLEYAEYVGNFYGTPMRLVDEAMEQGKDVLLDIEIQAGVRQAAGDGAHLHCAAQLEGAGAPSDRPRHRQPGKGAEALAPRAGGAGNGQGL